MRCVPTGHYSRITTEDRRLCTAHCIPVSRPRIGLSHLARKRYGPRKSRFRGRPGPVAPARSIWKERAVMVVISGRRAGLGLALVLAVAASALAFDKAADELAAVKQATNLLRGDRFGPELRHPASEPVASPGDPHHPARGGQTTRRGPEEGPWHLHAPERGRHVGSSGAVRSLGPERRRRGGPRCRGTRRDLWHARSRPDIRESILHHVDRAGVLPRAEEAARVPP